MKIADIAGYIGSIAPLSLQEDYDNAGLITGDSQSECTGVLCTLDVTEQVVDEAIEKKCNCIVSHHPIIFKGLKKITGADYVQRTIIKALKNDIAIYAIHTNLDNILTGVNGKIADRLNMSNRKVLSPKPGYLQKLYTFVPLEFIDKVRNALFGAGAGNISNYTECSFTHPGTGTFKPGVGTDPFIGRSGERSSESEIKLEVILPYHRQTAVLEALFSSHPYEEVAYDIVSLENEHREIGSGLMGNIEPVSDRDFLSIISETFNIPVIRHSLLSGKMLKKVAVCGGSGSFLISRALSAGADIFITADIRYHDFFGLEGQMLLCDIGHYESEQFTTDLLGELLRSKFPTFAVLKTEIKTNPVHYFTGK